MNVWKHLPTCTTTCSYIPSLPWHNIIVKITLFIISIFWHAEFLIAQVIKMTFFNDGSLRICRVVSHLFEKSFPAYYHKYLRWGNPIYSIRPTHFCTLFLYDFHCETCVTGVCSDPLQCLQFKMILYICLVNVNTEKYIIEFKLWLQFYTK